MQQHCIHNPSIFTYMAFLILFSGSFYSNTSHAYFIGYHSGGMHKNYVVTGDALFSEQRVYYSPRYHYKGAYKAAWTSRGLQCRKSCVLDRWTGKALSCYKTC